MPGRTPQEAFRAFIDPLIAATACIGTAKIVPSPGAQHLTDREHSWALNALGGGLVFKGGFCFKASMKFRYVEHEVGWRVTTLEYIYSLTVGDAEAWQMHWHPVGKSPEVRPHLHAAVGPAGTKRQHLPTSRMTYEDAIEWLIAQDIATPTTDKWADILGASKAVHVQYRSWSGDGPSPYDEGFHLEGEP